MNEDTVAEILMVEDRATDAELALRAFKRAGIANPLRIVSNGEHALDYLKGNGAFAASGPNRPFLILLDLQLPGMPGVDFLREVKADRAMSEIPVITFSLTTDADAILNCLRLGVSDHIMKPVDGNGLVRIAGKLRANLCNLPWKSSGVRNLPAAG